MKIKQQDVMFYRSQMIYLQAMSFQFSHSKKFQIVPSSDQKMSALLLEDKLQYQFALLSSISYNQISMLILFQRYFYYIYTKSDDIKEGEEQLTEQFLTRQAIQEQLNQELEQFEKIQIEIQLQTQIEVRFEDFDKIIQKTQTYQKFKEYQDFLQKVHSIIPNIHALLGSKSQTDIQEAIRIVIQFKKYGIRETDSQEIDALLQILRLIWSKDIEIKDQVLDAYWELYLNPKAFNSTEIANNLINIVLSSNTTDIESLEELMCFIWEKKTNQIKINIQKSNNQKRIKNVSRKEISDQVFQECFKIIQMNFQNLFRNIKIYDQQKNIDGDTSESEEIEDEQQNDIIREEKSQNKKKLLNDYEFNRNQLRAALTVIRIVSIKRKLCLDLDTIQQYIMTFLNISYDPNQFCNPRSPQSVDLVAVQEITVLLQLIYCDENQQKIQQISKLIINLLVVQHGTIDGQWFMAAQQVLRLIFYTLDNPQNIVQNFIVKLSQFLNNQENEIVGEFKNKNRITEQKFDVELDNDQRDKGLNTEKGDSCQQQNPSYISNENQNEKIYERRLAQTLYVASTAALQFLIHADVIKNYIDRRKYLIESKQGEEDQNEEDELEKIQNVLQEEREKFTQDLDSIVNALPYSTQIFVFFRDFCERLNSDIIIHSAVVNKNDKQLIYNNRNLVLDRVGTISLIQFMCVSKQCCFKNLANLFAILQGNVDPILQINILIGVGDLYRRFPIMMEEYLKYIYDALNDDDVRVKKTCLLVVTHLVLTDMLRIKGDFYHIALLIDYPDISLQNQVKLFFHELNEQDPNIIYNYLPELIQKLSNDNVQEETFNQFTENILTYLSKDKHIQSLVQKLLQKLSISTRKREQINISFALCSFIYQFNENAIKAFLDNFEHYREHLSDEIILKNFQRIPEKLKFLQFQLSSEMNNLLEQFQFKLSKPQFETFQNKQSITKDKPKKRSTPSRMIQQR